MIGLTTATPPSLYQLHQSFVLTRTMGTNTSTSSTETAIHNNNNNNKSSLSTTTTTTTLSTSNCSSSAANHHPRRSSFAEAATTTTTTGEGGGGGDTNNTCHEQESDGDDNNDDGAADYCTCGWFGRQRRKRRSGTTSSPLPNIQSHKSQNNNNGHSNHHTSNSSRPGRTRRVSRTHAVLAAAVTTSSSSWTPCSAVLVVSRYGRVLFFMGLCSVAALLGYWGFAVLAQSEHDQAQQRFESLADRAFSMAQSVLEEKQMALYSLAQMAAHQPSAQSQSTLEATMYIPGFEEIASSLRCLMGSTSTTRTSSTAPDRPDIQDGEFMSLNDQPKKDHIGGSASSRTSRNSISYCHLLAHPLVQQAAFEEFAYNLLNTTTLEWSDDNENPTATTTSSDFGRGIFNMGTDPLTHETFPDHRYPAAHGLMVMEEDNTTSTTTTTTGAGSYRSPRQILVPILQTTATLRSHSRTNHGAGDTNDDDWEDDTTDNHNNDDEPLVLFNIHSEPRQAQVLDQILTCAEERAATRDWARPCGSMTDMRTTTASSSSSLSSSSSSEPFAILMVHIYPKWNASLITGFIVAKTMLHDLLQHAFTEDVDGVYAVVRTETAAHTYKIDSGLAVYVGAGDWHDDVVPTAKYTASAPMSPKYFGNFTVPYSLELYSTLEYEESFQTGNPWIACVGAVAIIVFTSLLFLSYDFYVRKEVDSKNNLLQAKRQFVRFVSHEVRTPLNTVCMGLTLLQHDFAIALRHKDMKNNNKQHHRHRRNYGSNAITNTSTAAAMTTSTTPTTTNEQAPSSIVLPENEEEGSESSSSMSSQEQMVEWMTMSQQIYHNAETAVSVLNDLLNYDKIQMGTLTLELSLLSIWNVVEKVVNEFKLMALEKKVHLQLDWTPLVANSGGGRRRRKSSFDANMVDQADADSSSGPPLDEESGHSRNEFEEEDEDKPTTTRTTTARTTSTNAATMLPIGTSRPLPSAFRLPRHLRKHCKVVADRIRIAQVLRNLLSNGLKFSKEKGNLIVRVSERPVKNGRGKNNNKDDMVLEEVILQNGERASLLRRGDVLIEVIDDGVGMTSEQVRTVFNDGTQFHSNKFQAGGGSGLGLNIAKGIATQHGGELECYSEGMEKGATFSLWLPLYEEPPLTAAVLDSRTATPRNKLKVLPAECTSYPSDFSEGDESFVIPEFHILVVDDSATNLKLCMRLLSRNGHTCEGASDGVDGVRMVTEAIEKGQPYDCILLDYEMPKMNGPEACKIIRQLGCDSYIVGVTGNVMSEDVAHFRACGANCVLPKPFQLEALEQQWVEAGVVSYSKSTAVTGSNTDSTKPKSLSASETSKDVDPANDSQQPQSGKCIV
ncbi:hypothetical protein ACA910_005394 [Epithemia clementina (nom. ined.)]